MPKNELDLDEELNDNLDFLEEHDTDNNSSSQQSFSFNKSNNNNKIIVIIIVAVSIAITLLIIVMHNKNKSRHNIMTDVSKQQSPSLQHTSTQPQNHQQSHQNKPLEIPHATTPPPTQHQSFEPNNNTANVPANHQDTNNIQGSNNLTWQELKQSVNNEYPVPQSATTPNTEPTETTSHKNTTNTNFEINIPINSVDKQTKVNGFEYQTALQTNQLQANNNYRTQETISELKTSIENITNDLAANANKVKELQNTLQEISRSINNVSNSANNIDSKILNLTNTVDNLSMDVKNVKKYIQEEDLDLAANVKPSEQDLFSNTPEYVVHAVIPGRAWLKSSTGQIITVAEGDSLGDYGKIALIDTANNIVRTSSGVVFR